MDTVVQNKAMQARNLHKISGRNVMKISNERKNMFLGNQFFGKQDMDIKEKAAAKKAAAF